MEGYGSFNAVYEKNLNRDLEDSWANWQHAEKKAKQYKAIYDSKLMEKDVYEKEVKNLMRDL